MTSFLIVKTGTTYPEIAVKHGDFDAWFEGFGDKTLHKFVTWDARQLPFSPPDIKAFSGVVITGSPAMVSDRHEWSELTASWLQDLVKAEIPLLGICFGHQLLAHAMGGLVDYHPQGREIGTLTITPAAEASADPLFSLHTDPFMAHLTHRQSVIQLPEQAVLLASSAHEMTQAFRVGRCAWGFQFHPEFNTDIMSAYLNKLTPELLTEKLAPEDLLQTVEHTPRASALLTRFFAIASEMHKTRR